MSRKYRSKKGKRHSIKGRRCVNKGRRRATKGRRSSTKQKITYILGTLTRSQQKKSYSAPKKPEPTKAVKSKKTLCDKNINKPFIFGPDNYPYVVYKKFNNDLYWMVSIRHFLPTPKMNYGDELPDVTKAQFKHSINILKKIYKKDNGGNNDTLGAPGTQIPCNLVNKEGRYLNLS